MVRLSSVWYVPGLNSFFIRCTWPTSSEEGGGVEDNASSTLLRRLSFWFMSAHGEVKAWFHFCSWGVDQAMLYESTGFAWLGQTMAFKSGKLEPDPFPNIELPELYWTWKKQFPFWSSWWPVYTVNISIWLSASWRVQLGMLFSCNKIISLNNLSTKA